jgi:hypothetical protein
MNETQTRTRPAPAEAGPALRILTATGRTQGQRRNDFNYLVDGEPVYIGMTCDGATPDDGCGCARAWSGLDSHKAGTTAEVTETAMTKAEFRAAYAAGLLAAGWDLEPADLDEMAAEMLDLAAHFPAGTVVEHRGRTIQARRPAPAARRTP